MVVFFFISEFDRFNGGQRSLLQLVNGLNDVDIKPIVIFPDHGKCYDAFKNSGIDVRIISASNSLKQFGQGLMHMSVLKLAKVLVFDIIPFSYRVNKLMKVEKSSILHCNTTRSLLIGSTIPKLFGKKIVWHVRGELMSIRKPLLRLSEILADKIVLVAGSLINQIKQKRKCEVVYNAIDDNSFNFEYIADSSLRTHNNDQSKLVVSTMAALTPFKGYHHLIDAIKIVNEELKDKAPQFYSVGEFFDKEYIEFLKQKIDGYNIQNFEFLGWKDNPLQYYMESDIIVLPTIQKERISIGDKSYEINTGEGLPRTILEAMYLAKPVIATKVAGTGEQIVDNVTGFLVEPSNVQSLATALLKMINLNEEERAKMGVEAKKRAEQIFGTSSMLYKIKLIYKELLNEA